MKLSDGSASLAANVSAALIRIFVTLGVSLVTAVILARVLGPQGNGHYAVALLLPTFLIRLLELGVPAANVYFIGGRRADPALVNRATFLLAFAVGALGLGIGALVILTRAEQWFPDVTTTLLWVALLILPLGLSSALLRSLLQARQRFTAFNRVLLVNPIVTLVGVVVLVWWFDTGVSGGLLAVLLGHAVESTSTWIAVNRVPAEGEKTLAEYGDLDSTGGYLRAAGRYGWKVHAGNILTFVNYRADLFLVNLLVSSQAAGVYFVAVQMADRVWLLSRAVSTVLLPRLAGLEGDEARRRALTPMVARWVLWISAIGGFTLAVLAPWLVELLFGPAYLDAAFAIICLMPGIVLSAASRVLATDLAAFGRPDLNVWAMSAVVVVNVVANLLLIPHFGIVGAALATTLAWGVHAAIELVLYARTSGNHWWIPVLPRWSDVVLAIDLLRRATTPRRT